MTGPAECWGLLTSRYVDLSVLIWPLTNRLYVLQWDVDGGFPGCGSRGLAEEVLYDNAGLYDNLPSPTIFARSSPADRRASRPPADRLSSNHYKSPTSCSPPCSPSLTNTSSVGRASLGLHSQVQIRVPKLPGYYQWTCSNLTVCSSRHTYQNVKPP